MSGPDDTKPAPPPSPVDPEFVEAVAADLAEVAQALEGAARQLRNVIASLRQAARLP